jgi:hypothetical protein
MEIRWLLSGEGRPTLPWWGDSPAFVAPYKRSRRPPEGRGPLHQSHERQRAVLVEDEFDAIAQWVLIALARMTRPLHNEC